VTVGHIVIARPDKREAAMARLTRMGIAAHWMPAIEPSRAIEGTYARFNGRTIPRTPASQGAALSHMGALGMARAMRWEWVGLWEDDVDGAEGMGWRDLALPADCGVLHLGGILWGEPREYGEDMGARLWRVTQPHPISATHAIMINARALDDVIASCARMDMTIDDCVSRACMEATREGRWVTCFVWPWLAWQTDRPETRPSASR
jgi:hypothetical protein